MKEESKKQLLKLGVMFSPIFTILMYLLPWMGYYNERFEGAIVVSYNPISYSFFELLSGDIGVFAKIVMWASLVGIAASFVLYVLSTVFKDKEKLLIKTAAITLVSATGILFLSIFAKLGASETVMTGKIYKWVDFMSLPYAALIIYNVVSLFYVLKKMFK